MTDPLEPVTSARTLGLATLEQLPASIARPGYDPRTLDIGVLHFGPGAFHRAHQAAYFDHLAAGDPRWGIAAASLRTPGVVDALAAQDGLYSLTTLGQEQHSRVIGVHRQWLRPHETAGIADRLADPALRLVTSTVTEKGYCLAADGTLDLDHPDIRHDLTQPASPKSLIGWIVLGLDARRQRNLSPFGVLCCDNMTGNGRKLRAAVLALAESRDPSLADWIADHGAFPNSMVDSITPATDAAHLSRVAQSLGVADQAAVQREPFTQWVLEDLALPGAPDLASAGVILTRDVAAFERAKLRLLNGSHSALAYLGSLKGHLTVADAMADRQLAAFVKAMGQGEIAPTLTPTPELKPNDYLSQVLERFRNPGIRHLLSQIAWDGSQKLPYRLLSTAVERMAAGAPSPHIAIAVAGWMAFVVHAVRDERPLTDPLADSLAECVRSSGDPAAIAAAFLSMRAIFPDRLAADPAFTAMAGKALGLMLQHRVVAALELVAEAAPT